MSALVTGLIGAVVQESARDVFRFSKTKIFANVAGSGSLYSWIPGALQGDAESIGMLVLALVAWIGTLWGRGNKG